MANEPISGVTGSVTFGSGFVTGAYSWEVQPSGLVAETVPFSPVSNYMTRATAALSGWKGSYKCRQIVNANATISGPAYIGNAFAFMVRSLCKELEITKFTDTWRNYTAGLLDTEGEFQVYVENTAALPLALTTATGVFTINTGLSYSVPLITAEEFTVGVSVDGAQRIARIPFKATGAPTVTGAPVAGATGEATFQAYTGRTYTGTILVTSAQISVNRDNTNSEWQISFVGCGTLAAA